MQPYTSDRIAVVDVLRAFALFGIIVTHAEMGFLAGPPVNPQFDIFSSLDQFVAEIVRVLATGKFFSIFSFLFGLSFAIQLNRSAQKGTSFSGRFAWRLVILFVIGFVHNMFFSGDILTIYALLGLLLIPMDRLGSKVLAAVALVLVLNLPGITAGIVQSSGATTPSAAQQQATAAAREQFMATAKRQLETKQSGTLSQVVQMNVTESFINKFSFQVITGRLWITFGFFLLGICAGRSNLFRDTERNRRFFKGMLWWAGIPALITTVLTTLYPSPMRLTPGKLLAYGILCVQQVTLSSFYVAAVTLLYWRAANGGWLASWAPVGRMGLTTYLMQTAFGLTVFYGFGFGLLGRIGVASCVALGISFFILQFFFARWWLSYFNLGPIEWLWRSLTYLKMQPNARQQPSAA